jgi:hypothetical protein
MAVSHESGFEKSSRIGLIVALVVSSLVAPVEKRVNHEQINLKMTIEQVNYKLFEITEFVKLDLENIPKPKPAKHAQETKIPATKPTPKPLTPAQIAAKQVTPQEFVAWSKVNVCEEGGNWYVKGSEYSGGLGISNYNWGAYHGERFAPNASQATPDEQIVIAERIQSNPPDQDGCDGDW